MPDSRKSLKSAFSYKAIILVLANHHQPPPFLPDRHHPQNLRCLTSPGTCLLVYAQGHFALIPEISEVSLLLQSHHLGLGQPSPDHLARQAHPPLEAASQEPPSMPICIAICGTCANFPEKSQNPSFHISHQIGLATWPLQLQTQDLGL